MRVKKEYFEYLYLKYNRKDYIGTDPIIFPHSYDGNTEYIAFTAALFAYGNVKAMQNFLGSLFGSCGTDPFKLSSNSLKLKYRFQSSDDVNSYLNIMRDVYEKYGSLENLFAGDPNPLNASKNAILKIHSEFLKTTTPGLKFLFTVPGKSASKRLYMFLRWMIRKDAVDFGIWKNYTPSALSMPLDTHIRSLSTKIGIIESKDSDRKALDKVNNFFWQLCPEDPVRYDFALTRLGIVEKCLYENSDTCKDCINAKRCLFN